MDDEGTEKEAVGPRCGERLREARRDLQITVAEISKELHLDEAKVRALEGNDFSAIGAPVFAKGHLRKYAQLVKLDVDSILGDYDELNDDDSPPPVVSDRKRPVLPRDSGLPFIVPAIVIALIVVVSLLVWFFGFRTDAAGEPAAADAASEPAVRTAPVALPQAGPEREPSAEPLVAPAEEVVADTEEQAAEAVPPGSGDAPVMADGDVALSLSIRFSGDCWTEITDADGERLFFDLGRSGRQIDVSGKPPVSVLFGSADNAELAVDGQPYTIRQSERRGDTARLTLYKN